MAERIAVDGVGRVHTLTGDEFREDPVCGYLGIVVVVTRDTVQGYECPQCKAVSERGPGTVVVQRGDGGSGLL